MPVATTIWRSRAFWRIAILTIPLWSFVAAAQSPLLLSPDVDMELWRGDLDGMIERRMIRVLVPYSKTLYFFDLGGKQRGMSYDFMHAFEESLNKKLRRGSLRIHAVMIPVARDKLIPWLLIGRGDVAAANLTITPLRQRQVDFTIPLAHNVRELVVTGPGAPKLETLDDLAGKEIFVQRASSYFESLIALNQTFMQRNIPLMILRDAPGIFETEDLLEMANAGLVNIVIADNYIAHQWQQVYPNIEVHDDLVLRDDAEVAFAIRKNSPRFASELNSFAKTHRQGTIFGNVTLRKYLAETRWVKNATSPSELKRFNTLVGLFQKYGDRYGIDWLLLAAQGYQESQLDQRKRSPAGAIGVMQVMPATGKLMRVGDIAKLEPNIHAGAKYVRYLIDQYFDDRSIDELNKALLAFAAYNAGPVRIDALRKQALQRKLNANVWFDNVEVVVAQRVGRETVLYVSNIYKYYIAYSLVQQSERNNLPRQQPTQ